MPTKIVECGEKIQALLEEFGCKFEIQHNVVLVSKEGVTVGETAPIVEEKALEEPTVTILPSDTSAEPATESAVEAPAETAEVAPEVAPEIG